MSFWFSLIVFQLGYFLLDYTFLNKFKEMGIWLIGGIVFRPDIFN